MGLTFDNTHVTIAGRDLNTFYAAGRFTNTTVWSPAVLRWGTSDSLEPLTPATVSLRVTVPAGQRIPEWGDWVTVYTEGWSLLAGRIDGATREPDTLRDEHGNEYPVTRLELTASDELATLGRIRLADEPWPEQGQLERLRRIESLLAARGVSVHIGNASSQVMRARDVDSYPALDALTRTMAHTTAQLVCDEGTVTDYYPVQPAALFYDYADPTTPAWVDDDENLAMIDAACLESAGRTLDTGAVLASVTVNHPDPDPGEAGGYIDRRTEITRQTTEDEYGPGALTIDTDGVGDPSTSLLDRVARILDARSSAAWRIPAPVRVLLDRWTTGRDTAYWITRDYIRHGRPFRLLNGPPDLDPYHRVIGGTLTLHGDPAQQALELTTEPATNYAARSLSIGEVDIPIDALTEVTFADTRTIGRARISY